MSDDFSVGNCHIVAGEIFSLMVGVNKNSLWVGINCIVL